MQVLCGSAVEVLKQLPKESVDTVFTCPSPFGYYKKEEENLIGAETHIMKYILHLQNLCNACRPVLKSTGSLFIQLGDQFHTNGTLMGIPLWFEGHMKNDKEWLLNDRLISVSYTHLRAHET